MKFKIGDKVVFKKENYEWDITVEGSKPDPLLDGKIGWVDQILPLGTPWPITVIYPGDDDSYPFDESELEFAE